MKNLTERGVLVFFSIIITLVLLLSLQSCSSAPPCNNLYGEQLRKCHDETRTREAYRELVRSGFYEVGNPNK